MKLNEVFAKTIHRKIIQFFHENQASIDTPRGVATWIAEERTRVKDALEDLVRLKVLVPHRSTSTTGYSYTREPKLIKEIDRLLKKS
jgi:hypothetical protein